MGDVAEAMSGTSFFSKAELMRFTRSGLIDAILQTVLAGLFAAITGG